MSNALRRLRDLVGDPVLVKQGRFLVPTAWSSSVRAPLSRALRDLEAAIASDRKFDPSTADATITIAISDYWQFTLLPRLLGRLGREAPRIRLHIVGTSENVLANDLPSGAVSAAVFLVSRTGTGLHCETLLTDSYVFIVRRQHPLRSIKLKLVQLARFRQVAVAPRGPWSEILDEALHRQGLTIEPALLTAHNQVALDTVSQTNHFAVIPGQIARRACESWPLKILASPIALGEFSLGLYWHSRTDESPLHRWFRDLMISEARAAYFGTVTKRSGGSSRRSERTPGHPPQSGSRRVPA